MIPVDFVWLGAVIAVVGTAAYLRDTILGRTQPNRVTWMLWAVAPLLAFAVEIGDGVGLRALPTFMAGFMPLLVFLASFHDSAAVWKIRPLDWVCGALSVLGTVVWVVNREGTFAIAVSIAADFFAAVPTMVKSWTHPASETLLAYLSAALQSAILLLTVTHWTTAIVAFPLYLLLGATFETYLVGVRPRVVKAVA